MQSNYTLVVNLSLRSIRALVFSPDGKKVYEDWLPIRTYIKGDYIEQDPNEWWKLLLELLHKVFSHADFGKKVSRITVTSSALCLVVLDGQVNVLRPCLMVSDKRAQKEAKEIKEKFSSFFREKQSFKSEAGYFLPKILWLRRNEKVTFEKAKKYLSSNDYFVYKLIGKYVTDRLNAEKFYYDTSKNGYPEDLISFVGITNDQLPSVVPPGTQIGQIDSNLKKALNISQTVEIVISTYDAICALVGSSTYKEGELNNVCGTCSSYRFFTKKNISVDGSTLLTQKLEEEKLLIVGASNNLEGGVLEWAKECFYGDNFLKDDNFLYNLMQTEAKESELGANGIIFLPYLLGERMPFFDPDVRGVFFGIERFHSRKDIIRSVFEAVAFQAKLVIEEFHSIGFEISSINMSGGVAKMDFMAQLRADIIGVPINTLDEVETTALGAFIFSLKSQNAIQNIQEIKDLVKVRKVYIPNMHNHNCYSRLYILYKQLYTDHKENFKKRKEIFEKISHYRKQVLANL